MSANNSTPLTGSVVALITPMDQTGAVDYQALRRLIDWQLEQGTACISVAGTTGESSSLTVEEHLEVIRVSVEHANKRIPIMAGCGANSTHEAVNLAKQARKLGADYQLQVVPYYNKPTQQGIKQHFIEIAKETGDLPIFLYNVPGRVVVDMANDVILDLAHVPGICAIKEATGDMIKAQYLIKHAPADFSIFSGDDLTAVFLMLAGGKGNISVTANVAPKLMADLCRYAVAKDTDKAIKIQQRLFDLHQALFVQSNPIPVKWVAEQLGLCQNYIRLPLTKLEQQFEAIVKQALSDAKIN